jgi:hypothetical protein
MFAFNASSIESAQLHNRIGRFRRLGLIGLVYFSLAFAFHAPTLGIGGRLFGGGDGLFFGLPSKIFSRTLSPWNPLVQLGQYSYANTQYQSFYPPGLLVMSALPNTVGYNLFILIHYALAGLFCFLYCRTLRISEYASFAGGLFFLCCGFMIAHKGHHTMLSAAVWLPFVLLFMERYAAERRTRDLAFAGLGIALSVLAGFPQVTLYSMIIAGPYLFFRIVPRTGESLLRRMAHAGVAVSVVSSLAILLSSLQLLAAVEILPFITRETLTYQMFSANHFPWYHIFTFAVPNVFGGFNSVPVYSQELAVVETYAYLGLAPLVLSVLAVLRLWRRSRILWFWMGTAIVALVLSCGLGPVQYVLFRVPIYNLFRAPTRHMFEVDFALCILAAMGMDQLFGTAPLQSLRKSVRHAIVIAGFGLLGVFGFAAAMRYGALLLLRPGLARLDDLVVNAYCTLGQAKQIILSNIRLTQPTILCPVIFAVVTLGFLYLSTKARYARIAKVVLLGAFLGDTWSIYHTLYDNPDTRPAYAPRSRPEIAFLMDRGFDRVHFRMLPVDLAPFYDHPLLSMMYGIGTVNDYSPIWLKRYQRLGGFRGDGLPSPSMLLRPWVVSMTSAQYLLASDFVMVKLLRAASDSPDGPTSPVPMPSQSCASLLCTGATVNADTITLQPPAGLPYATVNFPLQFQRSVDYRITFEARADGPPDGPLLMDLYDYEPGRVIYDDPVQDRTIPVVTRSYVPYTVWISSGPAAPARGFVRFVTQSHTPLSIRNVGIAVADRAGTNAYDEVFTTAEGVKVFYNRNAASRFRFAAEAIPARDADEALALVMRPRHNQSGPVIVEGLAHATKFAQGRILSENVQNTAMKWSVETEGDSLFVVGDSWLPGWSAVVDGRPAQIRIVDGCFRGVSIVGKGRHSIEMRFWPKSLALGLVTTPVGILAGLLMIFPVGRFRRFRQDPPADLRQQI